MSSHPLFEPYVLTPFDHLILPIHFGCFLTFYPDDISKSIGTLEAGVTRLVSLLPFLCGNMVPSSKLAEKFEVQPPAAEFLQEHPMLKIKYHDQSIRAAKEGPSNEIFLPISYEQATENLTPICRFQVNAMSDGIMLCFNFLHMAIDGIGIFNVSKALAACCRDPNARSESLETGGLQEAKCRREIFEAASAVRTKDPPLKDWNAATGLDSRPPVSARLVMEAEKVAQLKNSCTKLLRRKISSSTIVMAAVWLCFIRARFGQKNPEEPNPTESCLVVVSDARSKLKPILPFSYIGNALVTTEAYISIESVVASMDSSNYTSRSSGCVESSDVNLLANLANSIHEAIQSVTDDFIREILSNYSKREDWTPQLGDLFVSVVRPLNAYELDFGANLGPVKDFDLPEDRFAGSSWILPAPGKGGSGAWEVRVTLEPVVMDRLNDDGLMKWLKPNSVSKL